MLRIAQSEPTSNHLQERDEHLEPLDLRLPTPGCSIDPERAGLDADAVFDGMTEHLFFTLGKLVSSASRHDLYMALSYAVRDRLMTRFLPAGKPSPQKTAAYLSAEFLIGPQLANNLLNLGIQEEAEEALKRFGIESLQQILEVEEEPGLGNGGLGPGGLLHGIAGELGGPGHRLRHPLRVRHLRSADPRRLAGGGHRQVAKGRDGLELPQPDQACFVGFGGRTESYIDDKGNYRSRWIPSNTRSAYPMTSRCSATA